ncbi:DUF1405 domain-containing protein [Halospeciosus flavus]|uniref:DUF1405 domain-containing protein n=1 Tax=Halospeciosus flavus TaxID=3032283 RepID=A0ABD5Z8Q5_9EURY|nr:DUF1405 domain-containing protein [Halospeciosus flavus]
MSTPPRESLPWYVAPLPGWLEDVAFRLLPVVVAANLLGTAFGFYYYLPQSRFEPPAMWLFVPDSPVATLFIGLSLAAWRLGRQQPWLDALAFVGCIKLGAWTPYVLLVFADGFSYLHPAMYHFLFWSHLAMVVQAFVVHRYSDFPVWAAAVAVGWYLLNDVVDYFVPVLGTPHHTLVPPQGVLDGSWTHPTDPHLLAAAGAVVLTVVATFLLLTTRVKKLETRV